MVAGDDRLARTHVVSVRLKPNNRDPDPESQYVVVLSDETEIVRSHWISMSAQDRAEYLQP